MKITTEDIPWTTEENKDKPVISVKEKTVMAVKDGNYLLETIQEQMIYAQWLIDKRLVSNTFKEPAPLIVAIQLCKDLGLPNSCLKDFYMIGGKPAIFGDTFVALALGSGLITEHSASFYDESGALIEIPKKGQKYFSCQVVGKRKGSGLVRNAHDSIDDKLTARNTNENFDKYPADMLFRRAMGRFIKWYFADAIRGIEMMDYAEDVVNNKLTADDKLKAINADFSGGEA
jgi:hypothetical protein